MDESTNPSFGSHAFTKMNRFLKDQSGLLGNVLENELNSRIKEIAPLILGIIDNSKAISVMLQRDLVNEAMVIERVFIERIINFCYLLALNEDEFEKITQGQPSDESSVPPHKETFDSQSIINAARKYPLDTVTTNPSPNLSTKIEIIKGRTNVAVDVFLIAISSTYPGTSETLSGSIYGCFHHLDTGRLSKVRNRNDFLRRIKDKSAEILFFCGLVISEMIRFISQYESIEEILKISQEHTEYAGKVIKDASSKENKADYDGLWESSEQMEISARTYLLTQLAPFEQPLSQCYECGILAPTIPAKRYKQEDMRIAALFLKRTLNDFRTVWTLTSTGYTSQSASVAASLFEHALAVVCIAGNPDNATKLISDKTGDLPWKPMELSKMVTNDELITDPTLIENSFEETFNLRWRELYSSYKWLCKIKHPTGPSVLHDAGSTEVERRGYVVMAAPDVRDEDLVVKATILTMTYNRCRQAIMKFVDAQECDKESDTYKNFINHLTSADSAILEAYKKLKKTDLPFSISNTSVAKEYAKLRQGKK